VYNRAQISVLQMLLLLPELPSCWGRKSWKRAGTWARLTSEPEEALMLFLAQVEEQAGV
jgi:hypothetical protein